MVANKIFSRILTSFLIVCGLLAIGFVSFLLYPKTYDKYWVEFNESITGLDRGSIVSCMGIHVGRVASFEIDDIRGKALVLIEIEKAKLVSLDNKIACLALQGITGSKIIDLSYVDHAGALKTYNKIPIIPTQISSQHRLSTVLADIDVHDISAQLKQGIDKVQQLCEQLSAFTKSDSVLVTQAETTIKELCELIHTLRILIEEPKNPVLKWLIR